jgi:hypothetical protein
MGYPKDCFAASSHRVWSNRILLYVLCMTYFSQFRVADSIRVIGTRVLYDSRLRLVGPRSRRPDLAGEEANLTDRPALGEGVLKKYTTSVD